jgi:hypothetical protein
MSTEVNLTHRDFEWIARFARDLIVAVERYKGDGSFTSMNEEASYNALCYVLDHPKDRQFFPRGLEA